jgi:hypothetical protein
MNERQAMKAKQAILERPWKNREDVRDAGRHASRE